MEHWDENLTDTTLQASRVASGCADLMRDYLELEKDHFHCCLKVLRPGENTMLVSTWARSENALGREDIDDVHPVNENSVWSALLGCNDGAYNWANPHLCFSCGNLQEEGDNFRNSRSNWREFYNATLVFPLRYVQYTGEGKKFVNIGFLAFDTTRTDGFGKMPNIFEFRGKSGSLAEYYNLLSKQTVFQLGAILADCMSMFLRPAYEKLKNNNNEQCT